MSEAKAESENAPVRTPDSPPAFKRRLLAYVTAWLVALSIVDPNLFLNLLSDPQSTIQFISQLTIQFISLLLLFFPAGLFYVFDSRNFWAIPFGWLIYIAHGVFLFLTSNWRLYFAAYALLVILLITNIHGCRKQLKEYSRVHTGR